MILKNSDDTWLVGDVFLRNYYAIFDDGNSELTLAPIVGGVITHIPSGTAPTKPFPAILKPFLHTTIDIAIGLIIVGGITVLILYLTGIIIFKQMRARNNVTDNVLDINGNFVNKLLSKKRKT